MNGGSRQAHSTRQLARLGLLTAVGLALSLLERQLPPPAPVPGVRWGLANAATLAALALGGPAAGFAVWAARFFLVQVFGGSLFSPAFFVGGAGGLLAWGAMAALSRVRWLGVAGVSAAGAVAHHVGQIAAAAIVTATPGVLFLLPPLLLLGPPVGLLTGVLVALLLRRLRAAGVLANYADRGAAAGAGASVGRGASSGRGVSARRGASAGRGASAAYGACAGRGVSDGDGACAGRGASAGEGASSGGGASGRVGVSSGPPGWATWAGSPRLVRPTDLLPAVGAVALALAFTFGRTWWASAGVQPTQAVVMVAGSTWRTLDLSQDAVYPVDPSGGHLVVEVSGGAVRVRESDCPDQVCVLTGWISTPGDMIVCVPYRVVIQVVGSGAGGPDAILR